MGGEAAAGWGFGLEHKAKCELCAPLGSLLGGGDTAEVRVALGVVGTIILRCIGDFKRFGTELNVHSFREVDTLEQR